MARNDITFGQFIREWRRRLDLTQEEVARRIHISTAYVGHLESGRRHPSARIVTRFVEVLGLDGRHAFLLANPRTQNLIVPEGSSAPHSAWQEFRNNEHLRRIHNISAEEMEILSRVELLGDVRSTRAFIYILNAIRHAIGR